MNSITQVDYAKLSTAMTLESIRIRMIIAKDAKHTVKTVQIGRYAISACLTLHTLMVPVARLAQMIRYTT